MDRQITEHFNEREFQMNSHGFINCPDIEASHNIDYLVEKILEPARREIGEAIIITSGYRCFRLNKIVGGAANSQHIRGEAADIKPKQACNYQRLWDILSKNPHVDQLLGGSTWIHVSCTRHNVPRQMFKRYYYKHK